MWVVPDGALARSLLSTVNSSKTALFSELFDALFSEQSPKTNEKKLRKITVDHRKGRKAVVGVLLGESFLCSTPPESDCE